MNIMNELYSLRIRLYSVSMNRGVSSLFWQMLMNYVQHEFIIYLSQNLFISALHQQLRKQHLFMTFYLEEFRYALMMTLLPVNLQS